MNGNGTSGLTHNYQMIDYTPCDGVSYYRLSQTDYDGNTVYFDTRTIHYKSRNSFTAGFMNASNNNLNIIINSSKDNNISLRVIDMQGKEVVAETFSMAKGSAATRHLQLQSGIYIVVLTSNSGDRINNKVIVQ